VGAVISLDEALDRLLRREEVLAAFLVDGPGALDVSAEDAEALGAVDRGELARTARQIREQILIVQHRGCGSLRTLYTRTIAGADEAGLAAAFVGSEEYAGYRELPFAGPGVCLEEAFYRFAEARGLGEAEAREEEFLLAVVRALVMSPDPDFVVPGELRRAPGGYYAVSERGEPRLFAALGGRMVVGPITPFLADVLRGDRAEAARRHGVDAEVLAVAVERFVALGLLAGA
jgi:hypothetical protein